MKFPETARVDADDARDYRPTRTGSLHSDARLENTRVKTARGATADAGGESMVHVRVPSGAVADLLAALAAD